MPNSLAFSTTEPYGRALIIREVEKTSKKRRVECVCECGTVFRVDLASLREGRTKSCGCLNREMASKTHTTHGCSNGSKGKREEYGIWCDMLKRCRNPNHKWFHRYGGRGIAVCAEWANNFAAFLAYIGARPTKEHTLDRWPNKDGNYEPGNVRWANWTEQQRNRSTNVYVERGGRIRLMIEVCEETGVPYNTAKSRRLRGVPDSQLFIEASETPATAPARVAALTGSTEERNAHE
jgi:hypothetical protein